MLTRRQFLRTGSALGTAVSVFRPNALARVSAASAAVADRTATDLAADEDYWREIQQAFTLDRTFINLNNGYTCPSPRSVHDALKRYLDLSNQSPYTYMWQTLEPGIETVRRNLAAEAGCDPEEIAITRNASEALQIAQMGLDLTRGDEVVTTNQDYGRMLTTWEQRVRRDGIKLTKISFPVPPPGGLNELLSRIEQAITPKTRIIHVCHITNLTGQIFPVREIARMARARGIRTIVDGAHAFAHFPFKVRDLECDYYGVSLHKWLLAPVGTGFLYVRREHIKSTWPLQAAPQAKDDDIRKFEEIGTHPAANHNAIAEALQFHQAIGTERRAARMRYLRARWQTRVERLPGAKILTSNDPAQSCGLVNLSLTGLEAPKVAAYLWSKHRIVVPAIVHAEYHGIRVTPNIYTTCEEIDTFAAAIEGLLRAGLPKETA
ncbi:MAG: aminotransferase class V-fold PLP-dependent enzyme [Vicinamibacterales bacterium]